MKQTKRLTPDERTWLNMRTVNRELRSRCASLERKVKRLEASCPCSEHEIEIARLERICKDIADRCQEAEAEVLQLRRLVEGRAA